MGKGKLAKFAEMETFKNVFQHPFSVVEEVPFDMKGEWRSRYFHNNNPIVLELGCGKGEYTVGLGKLFPNINFIGVDIKGARMWTGAKLALEQNLDNVAFLRTNIEIIDRFFDKDEVQEIWLTFSDPQMKNPRKRLTSTFFMERYRRFLMTEKNKLPVDIITVDLYHTTPAALMGSPLLSIQTYYESMWINRGLNIRYTRFHLPHNIQLQEPEEEIPLDEYRSYHRDKRSSKDTAR